jgi:hypothetical protein
MIAYLIFIIPVAVAVYLWKRARDGVTVPLSVWVIPVVLMAAAGAIFLAVDIDNAVKAARAAVPGERAEVFAQNLVDLFENGRFFFLGAAALAAAETAMAGRSGELRTGARSLFRTIPFWVGWMLGGALAALLYWQVEPARLQELALTELILALPPLIVAGTGVGIGHTLQRKTPSSFPFAIAGTGAAGLAAFYLGGRLTRWEADLVAFLGETSQPLLIGASSPNAPYDIVVLVATAVAGVCILALAILGAFLQDKPWKWGTLGDGILFLLVIIAFSSSLGWSWNATSDHYTMLDRLAGGQTEVLTDIESPPADNSDSNSGDQP